MKKQFVLVVGFAIVLGLLSYSMFFAVRTSEQALVVSFGKVVAQVEEPGLKFIWPWQKPVKFDMRVRSLAQELKETATKDQANLVGSFFLNWKIVDVKKFYDTMGMSSSDQRILEAENRMRSQWLSAASNEITKYHFEELFNTDIDKFKLQDLETGMLDLLKASAANDDYGIEVVGFGFHKLGVSKEVTAGVFSRMTADRQAESTKLLEEGKTIGENIVNKAKAQAEAIISEAYAKEMEIRAEGDAAAAEYSVAFMANPELAKFLRKIETLKKTLANRTTLVLDADSPIYKLLNERPEVKDFVPEK
ncbi:MAG: protease modulator HflC [Phycisphaerae bacterium]|nr:protease modulator HflC [Phycisphaerae bacterium]